MQDMHARRSSRKGVCRCVHLFVEEALSLTLEISKSVDHYYHDDMKSRKKE
jgi:hypothetical protein